MTTPQSRHVIEQIESARQLYHRLLLLVGPLRSGKTTVLRELQEEKGWPLLNLNLTLSEKLLELTTKQRALRLARNVDDLVQQQPGDTLLLDNLEMLFHPDLKQDPLRLLQSIARNRTVIAAWRGTYSANVLTYAASDHPEFRRYENPEARIVFITAAATAAQEHSA